MPHQVDVAVIAAQFEIPVIGREPLIEDARHDDAPVAERDGARRLLAAMSRIAFDLDGKQPVRHASTLAPWKATSAWRRVAARIATWSSSLVACRAC